MNFKTEIMKELELIKQQLETAMNWSIENIQPYLTKIMHKITISELTSSCAYIGIALLLISISTTIHKFSKTHSKRRDSEFIIAWTVGYAVILFISFSIIMIQAFDIIQAITAPEMTFLEYMLNYKGK